MTKRRDGRGTPNTTAVSPFYDEVICFRVRRLGITVNVAGGSRGQYVLLTVGSSCYVGRIGGRQVAHGGKGEKRVAAISAFLTAGSSGQMR